MLSIRSAAPPKRDSWAFGLTCNRSIPGIQSAEYAFASSRKANLMSVSVVHVTPIEGAIIDVLGELIASIPMTASKRVSLETLLTGLPAPILNHGIMPDW